LVTIEPGRSLLQLVTTNCLKNEAKQEFFPKKFTNPYRIILLVSEDTKTLELKGQFYTKKNLKRLKE